MNRTRCLKALINVRIISVLSLCSQQTERFGVITLMVSYLCVSVSVQYVLSDMSVTPLQLCILTYRWEKLLSTRPKLKTKKKKKVPTSEWGQALVVSSSHVTIYSYQTANESGKAPAHTLVLKSQNHNVLQNKHIHKSISSKPASLSLWPYVSLPCYKSFKITQINWQ